MSTNIRTILHDGKVKEWDLAFHLSINCRGAWCVCVGVAHNPVAAIFHMDAALGGA